MVTFTLVCAPGQEGPLWKVTVSAFSFSASAHCFLHVGKRGRISSPKALTDTHTLTEAVQHKSLFSQTLETTLSDMEFKQSHFFLYVLVNLSIQTPHILLPSPKASYTPQIKIIKRYAVMELTLLSAHAYIQYIVCLHTIFTCIGLFKCTSQAQSMNERP